MPWLSLFAGNELNYLLFILRISLRKDLFSPKKILNEKRSALHHWDMYVKFMYLILLNFSFGRKILLELVVMRAMNFFFISSIKLKLLCAARHFILFFKFV